MIHTDSTVTETASPANPLPDVLKRQPRLCRIPPFPANEGQANYSGSLKQGLSIIPSPLRERVRVRVKFQASAALHIEEDGES